MSRSAFILAFCLMVYGLTGQMQHPSDYRVRDSLITDAMKSESYTQAINLFEEQFALIEKHGMYDSLYHYCYNYGRALWKAVGPEIGIEKAKAISEKVKTEDPDVMHYLQTLNDLSWLYYETGDIGRCLANDSVYLAVCLQHDSIPANTLSIAWYNLGFDYMELGKTLKAMEHFRSAIAVLSNDWQPGHNKRQSMNYNALGAAQWHLGLLEEAKSSYETSLALIENETDPKSQLEKGNILGNMALIMQDNGEMIKAKAYQERFIKLNTGALPLIEDAYLRETALRRLSSAYINLADIYFGLGDITKSRKLVQLAIDERTKLLEPGDPSLASAIEHMAYLEMQSGNYDTAETKLNEYLAYCQQHFGEHSFKTAWAHKEMGTLYLKKKQYKKSEAHFDQAIKIQHQVGNPSHDPYLAKIYGDRSALFLGTGRPGDALTDLDKSMLIYSNSRESDNHVIVGILLQKAEIEIGQGNMQRAGTDVNRALSMCLKKEELSRQTPYLFPKAWYLKALLESKTGNSTESKEAAMDYLEKAISFLKSNKQSFMDQESKLVLYDAHEKIFELAEDLAYSLYDTTGDETWLESFFHLTEESRTILLRNRLQHFSALDYAGIPDSVLSRERMLEARLGNENEDLQEMKNIVGVERQYAELVEHIKTQYPSYYALKYSDKTFSIKEVQKQLLSDSNSLLVWSVTADYIYALLIDRKDVNLYRLPKGEVITNIRQLNNALVEGDEKVFAGLAASLSAALIMPIRSDIKHDELMIVPDRELFFLNFEILPGDREEGAMLIHDYTISYHLSTTVAMQFKGLQNEKPRRLLAFAPGFSNRQKINYRASLADSAKADQTFLSYIQQPFAVKTATHVAGMFSGTAFVEDEADESTFKRESVKYGIIHLGTHAEINHDYPLMSRLVFSKNVNHQNTNDGYLHAYEVYQMPLRAELAVLTACETGVGKQQNSEGVISLAHSFSYAGCPAVVMALWNIDEKTSAGIVDGFYHYLSGGMPKNKALRQAKLDYLKQAPAELQAPYYWAGLVLVGDTGAVKIAAGPRWITIFGVVVVLVMILVSGILFQSGKEAKQT